MENLKAARFVIATNVFLIVIKLLVAIWTGSIAIIAVLIDSIFDLVGSLLAYFGVKKASEPADADHHFGHGKYDSLASIGQLALIAIVSFWIIAEATKRLIEGRKLVVGQIELLLMLITILVDIGIVWYLTKKATKTLAIKASISNYTSDIAQNSAVFVGLAASSLGFPQADPIVAFMVALMMLRVVFKVGKETIEELTDKSPPRERLEKYAKEIMKVSRAKSFHRMRARVSGGKVHVDVHVQFDPKLSIKTVHDACRKIKQNIKREFPEVSEVLIHAEPHDRWQKGAPKFGS
ncbi:MAG: cation diffusion facilitator family transporter [Candidatus Micrarchaeota archaeon]|nr:cation diffusion facilitator family transporter [Candidatus Micrarchaeota archaeon]